jgi:hypothetical protein
MNTGQDNLEHGEIRAREGAKVVRVGRCEDGAAEHGVDRHHDAEDEHGVHDCIYQKSKFEI